MFERPIRVGILGAARIAPRAMIEPAKKNPDVEIACIAARDPERAKQFAKNHGIPTTENDYAALISRDDIDLVYVALPPVLHAKWTISALRSGKAVLCEKPFAMSTTEAQEMVHTSIASGKPLIEAFHYRFHRMMLRLVECISRQELGQILLAEASFTGAVPFPDTLWQAELGCGALTDVGCYPIHALRTLLGEPTLLSAQSRLQHGTFGEVIIRLLFPGDVTARISCALVDDPPFGSRDCWLRIEGTRGSVRVTNFVAPHLYENEFVINIDRRERREIVDGPTTYEAQLSHVVAVLNGKAEPITGGGDAVANMHAIDEIRAATGYADGIRPPIAASQSV